MIKKTGSQVNNAVEVLSYAEQVEDEFMRLYMQYDVANAPEKRKAEIIDSFWKDIYKIVFKPEHKQNNNLKSKIKPYDVNTIESILDIYFTLCNRFGGVILIDSFCELIGYSRNTVYMWNNSNKTNNYIFSLDPNMLQEENKDIYIIYNGVDINVINDNSSIYRYDIDKNSQSLSRIRYDVVKKIRETEQRQAKTKLSGSEVGMMFRANNEQELGFEYDVKRTYQAEQVKQIASAGQLPRFEIASETPQTLINKGL